MMKNEFERTINASDLQEWIMCTFPDWCEGDVRLIYDHIDTMPDHSADISKKVSSSCDHENDLIHREDALNCFHDWIDQRGDVHTADEMPEYQRIEQLPTVQPNTCENTCDFARKSNDMISRQQVLDALAKLQDKTCGTMANYAVLDAIGDVANLPTAQPYTEAEIQRMQDLEQAEFDKVFELGREEGRKEIIRCKDCNKASKCYGDVVMRSRGGGYIYCPLEFCSEAERRTDGTEDTD